MTTFRVTVLHDLRLLLADNLKDALPMRFSLRTLLIVILLCGAALGTTLSASPHALWVLGWIWVFAPLVGVLLAAGTRTRLRAFWIGFAAVALWVQVHQLIRHDSFVRTFRAYVGSHVENLHAQQAAAEAQRRYQRAPRYASLSIDEMREQFPREWDQVLAGARSNVTSIAGMIAWNNLRLGIAILGGIVVALLWKWRDGSTHARSN